VLGNSSKSSPPTPHSQGEVMEKDVGQPHFSVESKVEIELDLAVENPSCGLVLINFTWM
jgi:hypothetical protein